ncbi:MAG: phosphoribosylformylglycinamidine synthase subunit PurL [Acidimicrobiia bacterium]|nr:MAG: phosphoribosylformylglycinamidine synthase subunit PurL [Acidimicrobiia bacterium]GIU90336.1 MAG: phosphoribosylformylglycinamidine synthase subunit PurL [Acidimicrobiia bacterium]
MADDARADTEAPLHRRLGMTDDELAAVVDELGREPTDLELAMYSVMWSEHCSYKSSRVHLKRLPTEAPWVLVGPGEGAGVVDIGDGLAVAVRIESHNHPSAVEPYQGAATGVGGIIRDVFSMGARPIALMDPLRFGPLDDARTRYLFEGVVSGISGYGNSVGVPTVGGEVVFDDTYRDNPLVNVLCLGILPKERLVLARAEGAGNLAVLLGAATGRDGIGGASVLASAGFEEGAEAKRPSVQVGDPFEEKRLIEACLELLDRGLAVGVQDLGAAGLSCAASETAAAAGAGMDVDVARVARREPGMNPVEVMTSESQERMLAIVEPANLDAVLELARKWEVRATVVGRVTDTKRFRVYDGWFDAIGVPGANPPPPPGEDPPAVSSDRTPIADVPAGSLGDGPVYERPLARPGAHDARLAADPAPVLRDRVPPTADLGGELLALLATPTIADKSWVWRQYDHQLFLNTVVGPGGDAALLRVKGTRKAIALSTDGKARFCRLDPRTGARLAVIEAARNVACTGARPLALVNCCNFGNPEHPEVMWQFSEVVDGMSEACAALGIPVIGGNVSFYNESRGADIDPTPVVGVIGLLDELTDRPPGIGWREGDAIVVLGETRAELGGSEWAAVVHRLDGGAPPVADLERASALHGLVVDLVREREVAGVHDVSDGGLAVALAEMAFASGVGFRVQLAVDGCTPAEVWFSESASRVVVAAGREEVAAVLARAAVAGVPATVIGDAAGDRLRAIGAFDVELERAHAAWRDAIPTALGGAGGAG